MKEIKQKEDNLITNEIFQTKLRKITDSFVYEKKLKNTLKINKSIITNNKNMKKIVVF